MNDIDFYLQRFPNPPSVNDKLYLIKVTSSCEVSRFIERQPDHIGNDYQLFRQTLEREFSDELIQSGLSAAMMVKQGWNELPQQYYYCLLKAYFGFRNVVGMEEDMSFKTLFIQNLHPATSYHLGVIANPHTATTQQLCEWATLGFQKHRQAKQPKHITALTQNTGSWSPKIEERQSGRPPEDVPQWPRSQWSKKDFKPNHSKPSWPRHEPTYCHTEYHSVQSNSQRGRSFQNRHDQQPARNRNCHYMSRLLVREQGGPRCRFSKSKKVYSKTQKAQGRTKDAAEPDYQKY